MQSSQIFLLGILIVSANPSLLRSCSCEGEFVVIEDVQVLAAKELLALEVL